MSWMQAGLNLAPRLAESVLGKQEASLRELLRAFECGDIERALRRALPLGGDDRGATPHTGARLPLHNLLYSLRNILGDDSSGRGGLWITRAALYHKRAQEYHRQAELATQRGDFRRAAFIYAKLLRDYRAAAAVLARGGLHHDAAMLYLKRLNEPLAAAREFEAAGVVDRALVLYRGRGEHVLAGDLLRRVGEEEEALAEYFIAAEKMVKSGRSTISGGREAVTDARRPARPGHALLPGGLG